MKKIFPFLFLIVGGVLLQQNADAQCTLTPNNPTVSCATPCATLSVTPVPVNYNATTSYGVTSIPYVPYSYTTGTVVPSTSDDVFSSAITLPFNFCFFGATYSQIVVGMNGNISFNTALAGAFDPYEVTALPEITYIDAHRNCIMGSWLDYDPTAGAGETIKYTTYGAAPCRTFVVSYYNMPLFDCGTLRGTQQIVLHEATNVIEIFTESKPYCSAWTYDKCVTGISNNSATVAGMVSYTAPGENGTVVTLTNEAWRFSPTGASSPWTYSWTGPGGVVGAGTSVSVCPTVNTVYTVTATSTACTGGVSLTGLATVTVTGVGTPITGTASLCVGASATLSNATAGGTWSSSATGVATITTGGVWSAVAPGTATISYTSAAGCNNVYIVTVNAVPVISGILTVCAGKTTALTSSVTGGTWLSTNTVVATISATGLVTGVSAGTTIISYTTAAGCFTTAVATVYPVAAITGTAALCTGSSATLSDGVAGGTWSSTAPAVASIDAATGVWNAVTAGTSTISYTTPNGCLSTKIVTCNLLAPITGINLICLGNTSTLSNAATGGAWVSSNTAVATISAAGVVSTVTAGTTNIIYTSPAGCVSNIVVTVFILAPITGTAVACPGYTTTLSNSTGGGVWTSSVPSVATIDASTGIVTGIAGGTTSVTYTTASGCLTAITVTVNPTAPITGVTGMCQFFTTTLSDPLTGGSWSSSTPAVATVGSTNGVVTGVTGGTATMTYTMSTGCYVTTAVVVHPKPAPPTAAPPAYCQFVTGQPALIPVPATGITWYGPGVTTGYAAAPIPSTAVAGNDSFYATETSSFGCVSDSALILVHIIAKPAPPAATDTAYCQFFAAPALTATGSNLKWYEGGVLLGGAPVPSNTTVGDSTWYVTQTVNGCQSDSASIKVTTLYQPQFTITSRPWVCQFDSITLSYSGPVLTGAGYNWVLPAGAIAVNGTSVTGSTIMVQFDSARQNNIVYLSASDYGGACVTTETLSIKVVEHPTAYAYCKPEICQGDTVNLALSYLSPTSYTYKWLFDGVPMSNSSLVNVITGNSNTGGPYELTWNDSGRHIITVLSTSAEGCKSLPSYDTVNVHALPDPTFRINAVASRSTLCLEDSMQFIANQQGSEHSYAWTPEHFFNNNNQPVIWGKMETSRSVIMLTVTDPFGCKASSTQEFDPSSCCKVLFPTAFTPNGDNKNNTFHPIFEGYHRFHTFRIVNRWGQTVFETTNNNPEWNGCYNGVPQDMGVYYYFVKYDCGNETREEKGDVTLVR